MSLLRSTLLEAEGFRHAFSTRPGGVSRGAFASFNLGRDLGDDVRAVLENRRRLAAALDYGVDSLHEVEQVHRSRCVRLAEDASPAKTRALEADALIAVSGVGPVAVRTADCVPLLLACPRTGAVAAVHAGWRGAVAGVVPIAVDALLECPEPTRPQELLVAIGPHIRVAAFEVGEEVAARIQASTPGRLVIERRGGRPYADLAKLIRAQLAGRGVTAAHIDDVGGCTFSEPERFFSYRRDAGRTGRQLALIQPRR